MCELGAQTLVIPQALPQAQGQFQLHGAQPMPHRLHCHSVILAGYETAEFRGVFIDHELSVLQSLREG